MKILISGFYGQNNLGDDYILYALLSSIDSWRKARSERGVCVDVSCNPGSYAHLFSLFPDLKCDCVAPGFKNSSKVLSKIDLFIFGGGGLFPDDKSKSYFSLAIKCKKLRKKSIFLCYGIDLVSIRNPISFLAWKIIEERCQNIIFRNHYSANLLAKIDKQKKILYAPDITFSLTTLAEKNPNKTWAEIQKKYGLREKSYIIWALARPWSEKELEDPHFRKRASFLVSNFVKAATKYNDNGYTNVFVPFYHKSDFSFEQKILSALQGKNNILLSEDETPLEKKRFFFAHAKAAISMRFHGVAFSLYCGTPVLAISYSPKTESLMTENGLGEFSLRFGIRKTDCFFEEKDLNETAFLEMSQKMLLPKNSQIFFTASANLRAAAKEGEQYLYSALDKTGRLK